MIFQENHLGDLKKRFVTVFWAFFITIYESRLYQHSLITIQILSKTVEIRGQVLPLDEFAIRYNNDSIFRHHHLSH